MKYSILGLSMFMVVLAYGQPETETKQEQQNMVPMELADFATIKLLAPDTLGGIPLMQALQHRKSDRQFESKNLSLKHLSEILWVANGVNRTNGKRTVPSAMALYPLQTYAVLPNGIYFYNPWKHQLEPIAQGDYRELTGLQNFVKDAPLNLLFIADFNVYDGKIKVAEANRIPLASLDAGHCTQNVYLYCASEGLKTVVRAGAKADELYKVLKLDAKYKFILAQTVGY